MDGREGPGRAIAAPGRARVPAAFRGAAWMVGAAFCYASVSTSVRVLAELKFHPLQIIFFRAAFGLLVALPFILREIGPALATERRAMHLANGVVNLGGTFFAFFAFAALPLATSVSLTFTKPLFITLLAVPIFGEAVGWRRWLAMAAGFAGVMAMLRPGLGGAVDLASLSALTAALFFALQVTVAKKLAPTEGAATIILSATLVPALIGLPLALAVWRPLGDWGLMLALGLGLAGCGAQYFTVRAIRVAQASVVAPFDYFRLLFAMSYGFALFGEVPDGFTLVGAGIIVASTLYITHRERAPAWPAGPDSSQAPAARLSPCRAAGRSRRGPGRASRRAG
ncbi:MAG: DMT family transporter [Proteobacteria bacterium]|nr:DMT family transporter [Pseudomonadota bacterium]